MNIKPEAAKLLYQLGLMYDRVDKLKIMYDAQDRPEKIQLIIDLFKLKIRKIHRQISELD